MRTPGRVLFVDNDVDSFYAYRIELARAVRDAGFDVHVACPPGRSAAILFREGLKFHPIPLTRCGLNPWREIASIVVLFRLYRSLKPALVHHLRLKPVLYGGIAAYFAGVQAVIGLLTGLGHVFTSGGAKTAILRRMVRLGFRVTYRNRNHKLIFQNPDDRSIFVDARVVRPEQAVLIKGSGVDPSVFRPTQPPNGVPVVVLPSRMLRDKGVVEFVEAAESLKNRGVEARFVLVGGSDNGNPTAIPLNQLEKWHRSGSVEYWGPQSDMRQVYAKSHVVCLPSLREGVPKALIEAAACGRPLVATDVPGCREIVRSGENGLLVPARDAVALAGALQALLEDSALRARMGARARELAVSEFSLDRVIAETMAVHRELLSPAAAEVTVGLVCAFMKRLFDGVASAFGLIALAPVLAGVALAIKLGSPGPVFYRGVRAGLKGAQFRILKFRTMVVNAEQLGGSATATDDPRITPIGAFLRRHKLDELPQLINVLVGDMSLVGPRPEVQKYVDLYSSEEKAILAVRPGITDWASIWNSNEGAVLEGARDPERAYEELIRPTKIALQLFYVRKQSLWMDLRIILHTFLKLLRDDWEPRELASWGKIRPYKTLQQALES